MLQNKTGLNPSVYINIGNLTDSTLLNTEEVGDRYTTCTTARVSFLYRFKENIVKYLQWYKTVTVYRVFMLNVPSMFDTLIKIALGHMATLL